VAKLASFMGVEPSSIARARQLCVGARARFSLWGGGSDCAPSPSRRSGSCTLRRGHAPDLPPSPRAQRRAFYGRARRQRTPVPL